MVVAVGTSDAFHALQTDVQVASRFEPLLIPRWTETDAFRAFVVAYGKLLPLRKASPYGEPEMIRVLIKRSDGITSSEPRPLHYPALRPMLGRGAIFRRPSF